MTLPFGQTVELADALSVGSLVVLEALLSADNAVVLAMMVRHLPKRKQKQALGLGLSLALVFRFIAIVLASLVLKWWWLQAIGAAYLLYLCFKHLRRQGEEDLTENDRRGGMWLAVGAIGLTDLAFAIDSVLAGVTFINNHVEKLWVVYAGALAGVVLLRLAAQAFTRLLAKYPSLDHVAYIIIGWVAVKLSLLAAEAFEATSPGRMPFRVSAMPEELFYCVLLVLGFGGFWWSMRHAKPNCE